VRGNVLNAAEAYSVFERLRIAVPRTKARVDPQAAPPTMSAAPIQASAATARATDPAPRAFSLSRLVDTEPAFGTPAIQRFTCQISENHEQGKANADGTAPGYVLSREASATTGNIMVAGTAYPHVTIPFTGFAKEYVPKRSTPSRSLTFTTAHYSPGAESVRYNYTEISAGSFQSDIGGGADEKTAATEVTAALKIFGATVAEGTRSKAFK
jgi:hypothetical protein